MMRLATASEPAKAARKKTGSGAVDLQPMRWVATLTTVNHTCDPSAEQMADLMTMRFQHP